MSVFVPYLRGIYQPTCSYQVGKSQYSSVLLDKTAREIRLRKTNILLTVLLFLSLPVSSDIAIPRANLFSPPDLVDVQLSPDGQYISYLALDGDRVNIWLAQTTTPAKAYPLINEKGHSLFRYKWAVNSKYIIYQTGKQLSYWKDSRDEGYVVYSVGIDNGKVLALTPSLDRRIKFTTSKHYPDEIFISPSERAPLPRNALRVNIVDAKRTVVTGTQDLAPLYADQQFIAKLATQWGPSGGIDLLIPAINGNWKHVLSLSSAERPSYKFFGFNAQGKVAYIASPEGHDRAGLFSLDTQTGQRQLLARPETGEVIGLLLDQQHLHGIAYRSRHLRSSWTVLDEKFAKDFRYLQQLNSGDMQIHSRTTDDAHWLVSYLPGNKVAQYYLYERKQGKATFLFSESKERDAQVFSLPQAVVIPARDGLKMVGYLTLPRKMKQDGQDKRLKKIPVVIWIHGGPVSREYWRFDTQAQWLADRGYGFLNINYRGSAGFGRAFVEAGYGEWGRKMQSDILDAAQWLIKEEIAEAGKIAVMGLSYGGYATLNALADGPGLFACGIQTVGLSDLNLFLDTLTEYEATIEDNSQRTAFRSRLERDRKQIGDDNRTPSGRAGLLSRSPISRAREISQPVMIVHGERDRGVLPEHSNRMVAALQNHKAAVTYLSYANEGHGLFHVENRRSFAAVSEVFLQQCLGGEAEPLSQADFAGASLSVPVGAERVPGLGAFLQSGLN